MINIELDFREVSKNLKKLYDKQHIQKAINRANAKIAIEIRRDVISKTPRDSGDLLNSWRQETSKSLFFGEYLLVGFDSPYAQYQHEGKREDGTHIIVNRPAGGETYFLQKAIQENLKKYRGVWTKYFFDSLFSL